MAISFRCPTCGKSYKVREDLAGKRAKCSCEQSLIIPQPASSPPSSQASPQSHVSSARDVATSQPPVQSFEDWMSEALQEPDPPPKPEPSDTSPAYGSSGGDYSASAPPKRRRKKKARPVYQEESEEEGGALAGLVIFVLIFGVGNWILYHFTGFVIIPIPRR